VQELPCGQSGHPPKKESHKVPFRLQTAGSGYKYFYIALCFGIRHTKPMWLPGPKAFYYRHNTKTMESRYDEGRTCNGEIIVSLINGGNEGIAN
jgi:hypothetical protein